MRRAGRWVAAARANALVGAVSCGGVSGSGGDGGPDNGGGFLGSCPDAGGQPDGGGVDSGVPDSGPPPPPRPSVRAIDPPDGWTFVGRDTAVKVDVFLPNVGQGV